MVGRWARSQDTFSHERKIDFPNNRWECERKEQLKTVYKIWILYPNIVQSSHRAQLMYVPFLHPIQYSFPISSILIQSLNPQSKSQKIRLTYRASGGWGRGKGQEQNQAGNNSDSNRQINWRESWGISCNKQSGSRWLRQRRLNSQVHGIRR